MSVELLSHYGDDLMVANVARVSYAKEAFNYSTEQNAKLINFLAKHNHWSPFSHPQLQFRIKCPIYVERQIFKTQVGVSVNSISGRYVDFSDTYTSIKQWRKQSTDSKQGSEGSIDNQKSACLLEEQVIETCQLAYQELIKLGVCKEQARTILPLCLNTEYIWTGSLYALVRLCKQRLKDDVQRETREVVNTMLYLVENIENNPFEYGLRAFNLKSDPNYLLM